MISRWCDQSIHDAGHSDRPNGFYLAAMLFGTPVAETILASVHVRACQKAGTYGPKRSDQSTAKTPCEEAVHIWV
jgi:hypothetical protein